MSTEVIQVTLCQNCLGIHTVFVLVLQNWAKGILLSSVLDCCFRLVFLAFAAFVHSLSVSRFAAGFYRAMSMSMAMAIVVFAVLITNAKLYHRSCQ